MILSNMTISKLSSRLEEGSLKSGSYEALLRKSKAYE